MLKKQKLTEQFFTALLIFLFKKAPPPKAITDLSFFNSFKVTSFSNFLKYCSPLFLKIILIETPSFFSIKLSMSINEYESFLDKYNPTVVLPTPIMPVKTRFLLNLISDFEFDFS